MKLPQINRHLVGVSALALTIMGLGVFANTSFNRPAESLAQLTTQRVAQPATATESDLTALLSQLKEIPKNAFGYAQPGKQAENALADNPSAASEARNWNEEEWRLASAAVAAYRRGGEKALSSLSSSDMVWQPPEEIANHKAPASR